MRAWMARCVERHNSAGKRRRLRKSCYRAVYSLVPSPLLLPWLKCTAAACHMSPGPLQELSTAA